MEYWPFRTEEEVQAMVQKSNERQKQILDQQLEERRQRKEFEQREAQKRLQAEQVPRPIRPHVLQLQQ